MTEKSIDEKCAELESKMREVFGDRLVDPEIFPRIFNYQAKLALFELALEKKASVTLKEEDKSNE